MVLYYSQLTVLNSEFILFWVFNLFAFNTLLWIPIPILLIFITYEVYKIKTALKSRLLKSETEIVLKNKEYQLYLLFLGIILPLIEIVFEIYKIRPKSLLIPNCSIGLFLFILYLLSTKYPFFFKNIKTIFISLFLIYFVFISRNLIYSPADIIPILGFIVNFFFSYSVLKPIKLYKYFDIAVFS